MRNSTSIQEGATTSSAISRQLREGLAALAIAAEDSVEPTCWSIFGMLSTIIPTTAGADILHYSLQPMILSGAIGGAVAGAAAHTVSNADTLSENTRIMGAPVAAIGGYIGGTALAHAATAYVTSHHIAHIVNTAHVAHAAAAGAAASSVGMGLTLASFPLILCLMEYGNPPTASQASAPPPEYTPPTYSMRP